MTKLGLDIEAFATNLANELTKFIDSLPTPAGLMRLAVNGIKAALIDGLCVSPSCPGTRAQHINSGKEEDIVKRSRSLGILASHQRILATHPCHTLVPSRSS